MSRRLRPLAFAVLLVLAAPQAGADDYLIRGDVAGHATSYIVQEKDTLYRIGRSFDAGIGEMEAANPRVDPWLPKPGTVLAVPGAHILPTAREGIVIDLARLRLFYFLKGRVLTFPVGVGKQGWATPTGVTRIALKRRDPVWRPPASIRAEDPKLPEAVPAGPDNPMGAFAMNLAWPGYAIHGTNRPYGIGRRSSHGCIRLYPEDISTLFQLVPAGTKVTIVREPLLLGWKEGALYMEVSSRGPDISFGDVYTRIIAFAGDKARIDWTAVRNALHQKNGIAVEIGRKNRSLLSLVFGN